MRPDIVTRPAVSDGPSNTPCLLRQVLRLGAAASVLALFACAPLPEAPKKEAAGPLVFPSPPDPPRFFYERSLRSSADVRAEDEKRALRRLLTGETEEAAEGMSKPYAVTVHRGRVFVSDTVKRFVSVFDFPNQRFYRVGDEGPGQLSKPAGLDVDGAGNLYVADSSASAVVVFDKEGRFLRRIGGTKWFDRLVSVTVEPNGERMYVVDVGGVRSKEHRIRVFDPVNGRHLFDFGTRGTGPGEFNFPYDLAVCKEGRLYVVDAGNFRVDIFDRDGHYLKSFGGIGKQPGNFARPKEIACDRQGNVYVADAAFGNFQIFDPEGRLLMFIGEHGNRDEPAKYKLPSGIYVDEDGRVYFVDQWFKKIDVFRPVQLKPDDGFLARRAGARSSGR